MGRKISVSVALAITIIVMTLTFSITWIVSMRIFDEKVSAVTQLQAQYSKLAEIDNYVRGNFYGEIDDDALFDRVAAGYMNGLGDRYCVYYTAEEYQTMLDTEAGRLVGVGIELLRAADGSVSVGKVYADSPAARAGVTQGARILRIDGVETRDFASLSDMRRALMGGEGTELTLTCLLGVAEEGDFTIQRVTYTAPTVQSIITDDGLGYIRIFSFGTSTYSELDYVIRQLQNQGATALVFDVRNNNGGAFSTGLYDIIDMLCPLGTIANQVDRAGVSRALATSDENAVDLPMAVLVNGGTSAAAELFAVSIKELAGGTIVGTRTVGRGTIQSAPNRLADGSAVVVTRAVLYTGTGWTFNGVGVEPDILAEGEATDDQLLNPDIFGDAMILRALEVARTMAREAGGTTQPPVSSEPVSSGPASSEVPVSSGPPTSSGSEADGGDGADSDVSGSSDVPDDTGGDG